MFEPFRSADDARRLAQGILDALRQPLLILDEGLSVVAASHSFYETFKLSDANVLGQKLDHLGAWQWRTPALTVLLDRIIPDHFAVDDFEIEYDFPSIGHRIMLLTAREVVFADAARKTILLAFDDITKQRAVEREHGELLRKTADLLKQKETLLIEMQHRVANSLQLIASILMLKAKSVSSEETRQHLEDAHHRVLSIAVVQRQLRPAGLGEQIELAPYLTKLCQSLAASMIGDISPVSLKVVCDAGFASPDTAVSVGLVVTELVINCLKHAFPKAKPDNRIVVSYEVKDKDWMLAVSDNGVGRPPDSGTTPKIGLGTSIIKALSQQLDAQVAVVSTPKGMTVSLTHATFTSRIPKALS